jgi:hypothetical protein
METPDKVTLNNVKYVRADSVQDGAVDGMPYVVVGNYDGYAYAGYLIDMVKNLVELKHVRRISWNGRDWFLLAVGGPGPHTKAWGVSKRTIFFGVEKLYFVTAKVRNQIESIPLQ